ncbi:hypothetical protein BC831DRAFT_443537 [Entophlyctis helioformis]|nr:hypothetical protein BC831DRAFT_443537 [Entophlyctis helioformis]
MTGGHYGQDGVNRTQPHMASQRAHRTRRVCHRHLQWTLGSGPPMAQPPLLAHHASTPSHTLAPPRSARPPTNPIPQPFWAGQSHPLSPGDGIQTSR